MLLREAGLDIMTTAGLFHSLLPVRVAQKSSEILRGVWTRLGACKETMNKGVLRGVTEAGRRPEGLPSLPCRASLSLFSDPPMGSSLIGGHVERENGRKTSLCSTLSRIPLDGSARSACSHGLE
jgi:hypothetical protein